MKFSDKLPPQGRALDLACGAGRNSIYLVQRGLRVVAVDRAWNALEQGKALATARQVEVAWLLADLERIHFPQFAFDVVICFFYRDPNLYAPLRHWLKPGGLLIYQTFTRDQLLFGSGPKNPAHLLEPGELLSAFADWEIIFHRETRSERGIASLVARRPART